MKINSMALDSFQNKDKFIYAGEFEKGVFQGLGRYWDQSQLMLFQGEFQHGQKNGNGRLETYRNNISYGSLIPQSSSVTFKTYKKYILETIIQEIKRDLEEEVTGEIRNVENKLKDKFNTLSISETDYKPEIDEFRQERTKSTFEKRYIGEFKHDFKHGLGTMKYSNGDVYEGEYRNDKRHGFGRYIYLSISQDSLLYIGQFQSDTMNGEGKMIFKDKTEFNGKFKNNRMHDEDATFKYANGDIYHGGIAHNFKHSKDGEYIYN